MDLPRDIDWSALQHAYGSAEDVPGWLSRLRLDGPDGPNDEPWYSLWSALAHQGDVYSASFAAVPHLVDLLAADPSRAGTSFFQLPTWIEICRDRHGMIVPEPFATSYAAAMARLPNLAFAAIQTNPDQDRLRCALAAIALGRRQPKLASVILKMSPDVTNAFEGWLDSR